MKKEETTMRENNATTSSLDTQQQKTRPTIGLFTYGLVDTIGAALWQGVEEAVREHDVNLVCFSGGTWHDFTGDTLAANVLYDFVSAERIDGLIIWVGLLHHVDPEVARDFYRRYAPIPVVSIGLQLAGIPTVMADNYAGMYSEVEHLVGHHGYSRIAFIRGPEGHEEAEDRYRAYQDVLAAHGINVDLELVTPGNNQRSGGGDAVKILFDERRLRPQVDVEAIVGANDNMAFGALEALQARGIAVPHEVAVVGFDDSAEGLYSLPTMTSVPWPGYAQGRQAVELLMALLHHADVPALTRVPTTAVIRESCGCVIPEVVRAAEVPALRPSARRQTDTMAAVRDVMVAEMAQALAAIQVDAALLAGLVDAFIGEFAASPSRGFLPALEALLWQTVAAGSDVNAWHHAVSILRRHALPYMRNEAVRSRAENLWQQARIMIGHEAQRAQARLGWRAESRAAAIRYFAQMLASATDLADFAHILPQQLPSLGIPGCSIALFEDPEKPLHVRLLVARDGTSTQETSIFPARLLLPDSLWHQESRFSRVLEALYVRSARLGYVLFEVGPQDGSLYVTLREQISNVLRSLLLMDETRRVQAALQQSYAEVEQQVASRTADLQHEIANRETLSERRALQVQTITVVSQEIAAAPTLDELYRRVVTLIKERFDYYHVQIFRYDPQVRAVRLVAGYGEVGQKMLEAGYFIDMGVGIVGTAAETGEPVLANEVTPDPQLPETQGELAVPIKLREQVFGILDVQSNRVGALTLDDQLLLEQLGGQIAIAIENTSLREEMEERLQTLNMIQEAMAREGWEVLRAQQRGLKGYAYEGGVVHPLTQVPAAEYTVPVVAQQDQVIGCLGVQEDPARPLSAEERALLTAIAEQVTSALDRARLFEDTRRSAARDQLIGELGTQMRASLDIDQVLQTAVREMVNTLNLARVEVRLSSEESVGAAAEEVNV
ncbi:MAG TPA: substrate-binding domain-containing protein [Anaerolineae bacterium]|nr:substrate-binding domain-containing protein [Anaerolineae bacterium]HQH37074.1 substrate-binding domain-containing protein [Anaerolineae bacterium]